MLLTDPAASPPRATDDVVVGIGEPSRADCVRLEARLREAGHSQPLEGPNCRWRIGSAPYRSATKLEAFDQRGAGDCLFRRDLGGIIALVDGRAEAVDEALATAIKARTFIADAFRRLFGGPSFLEDVPACLLPHPASQARAPLVTERMRRIAGASPAAPSAT